jgi:Tfp pilus assembly PilM family ATPase
MPIQTAVDLSRVRVRAVEIDGSAKSPRVKSFTAVDVPPPAPPAPPAEGAASADLVRHGYGDALAALAAARRFAKDPAGIAIASLDCTFREIDLPFTTPEQIDRVVKFEAESHLQLVDIDSVVVSYQLLDSDGRGGSRLLIAACLKETIKSTLAELGAIGVDPQTADLHLTALYGALKTTGYFVPPEPPPADAPPDARPMGETVIALECDSDLTHLLVARGDTLVVARALRLGGEHAHAGQIGDGAPKGETGDKAAAHAAEHSHAPGHEHDETLVVVDDLGGEEAKHRRGGDYFARLRREVSRTLLKLGPVAGDPTRILLMGRATRDPAFAGHVQAALHLPVEVVAPYERVAHDLDEAALADANREGVAALGVALRMLGNGGGSQIEFRREEVRYARRFDQVKVALACFSIALLVAMALLCIERIKRVRALGEELFAATGAVLAEYSQHAESSELYEKVNKGTVKPLAAVNTAKQELAKTANDLRDQLGRSTSIPRLPGGLDYLNAVITAIDGQLDKIGRLQLTTIDLDVSKEKPTLKLSGIVTTSESVDVLVRAIRSSPAVANVQEPPVSGTKDQRLQFSNLEIDLVPGFDPRSGPDVAKEPPAEPAKESATESAKEDGS